MPNNENVSRLLRYVKHINSEGRSTSTGSTAAAALEIFEAAVSDMKAGVMPNYILLVRCPECNNWDCPTAHSDELSEIMLRNAVFALNEIQDSLNAKISSTPVQPLKGKVQ